MVWRLLNRNWQQRQAIINCLHWLLLIIGVVRSFVSDLGSDWFEISFRSWLLLTIRVLSCLWFCVCANNMEIIWYLFKTPILKSLWKPLDMKFHRNWRRRLWRLHLLSFSSIQLMQMKECGFRSIINHISNQSNHLIVLLEFSTTNALRFIDKTKVDLIVRDFFLSLFFSYSSFFSFELSFYIWAAVHMCDSYVRLSLFMRCRKQQNRLISNDSIKKKQIHITGSRSINSKNNSCNAGDCKRKKIESSNIEWKKKRAHTCRSYV